MQRCVVCNRDTNHLVTVAREPALQIPACEQDCSTLPWQGLLRYQAMREVEDKLLTADTGAVS